jgi:GTP pyrophosphokinase
MMTKENSIHLTPEERLELLRLNRDLRKNIEGRLPATDFRFVKQSVEKTISQGGLLRDNFGFSPIIIDMQTAYLVGKEIGLHREIILSIMLNRCVQHGTITIEEVKEQMGENVANMLTNLTQINALYAKSPTIESENFRNLLLSFANDMRIILIMIASRLVMLRRLSNSPDIEGRRLIANEASQLYIPLAHKLGFYKLKSEMEDLSLRYTEPEIHAELSQKLEETAA